MAYLIAEPESAEEEALRVSKVTLAWLGEKLRVLGQVKVELIAERRFIDQMTAAVRRGQPPVEAEIARVKTLEWKYRRQLPVHARPKLNPDDPIVREMEANRGK